MIPQLRSAFDDHIEDSAADDYVEIPAKIGFFKKLRLEREGKELPKERIDLPLELAATIWMLGQAVALMVLGGASLLVFYLFLLGPENVFSHASLRENLSIGERVWLGCIAIFALFIGVFCLVAGIKRLFDFFRTGPLLVIEKEGLQYTNLSAALIPWADIAYYGWIGGKGGIYGIQFYLRNVIPEDRRWLHKRFERTASRRKWGATSAIVILSGLSSSKRTLIAVIEQLAVNHGAKHFSMRDNPN